MSERKLTGSKQKVTLYLSPEIHRKAKIQAAVECESMSAVMEKALSFYLDHPEAVEGQMGQAYQVHACPACEVSFVMREGSPQLLPSASILPEESDVERAIRLRATEVSTDGGHPDLVATC